MKKTKFNQKNNNINYINKTRYIPFTYFSLYSSFFHKSYILHDKAFFFFLLFTNLKEI